MLSYYEQNQAQNIGSRYGVILTDGQMQKYYKYRADAAFSKTSDPEVLYMVLTPTQRERFDLKKKEYGL